MWFEVAIVASLFVLGNILFGHFEEGTAKWRRVLKFIVITTTAVVLSATAGRTWFFVALGTSLLFPFIVHLWWLPRHGINGWTAEPKERYYKLRGWKISNRANQH